MVPPKARIVMLLVMLGGAQKAAAQVGSVQDFMKMMGAVGSKLIVPGGLNATMAQFVKEVRPLSCGYLML